MPRRSCAPLAALCLFPAISFAQQAPKPAVLSRAEEMELALSAAPEHLRAGAGVYVLEASGYVRARESSNGFTCIVNRDSPRSIKPTCYDAEGTATILPKVVRVGAMLMQGRSAAEIDSMVVRGFRDGTFIAPRRPGVAYMLSDRIRNENTATGQVSGFPPHVMFYAPNLTNKDIGATPAALRANPHLPFIAYQGPHGFMVMIP
ncbi:MAG: hypothetical protein AB7I33_00670 [Gemmatimonadales bacterium]